MNLIFSFMTPYEHMNRYNAVSSILSHEDDACLKREQAAWKQFQQGVKETKAAVKVRRGDNGRLLSKEAREKVEAEATFLLYKTYLQTKDMGQEHSEQFQGHKYGRDEH